MGSTLNYLPEQFIGETFEIRHEQSIFETPQERYIYRCVKGLVDDVCLHYAKLSAVKHEYNGASGDEKRGLAVYAKNIPLRSVPLTLDADVPAYRLLTKVELENEIGEMAGYFGWCIMCRGSANLYCKETRVPICSVDCKTQHQRELRNF